MHWAEVLSRFKVNKIKKKFLNTDWKKLFPRDFWPHSDPKSGTSDAADKANHLQSGRVDHHLDEIKDKEFDYNDEKSLENVSSESDVDESKSEEYDVSDDEEEYNCYECGMPEPPQTGRPEILWIQCEGSCANWYHKICVRLGSIDVSTTWECEHCISAYELLMG